MDWKERLRAAGVVPVVKLKNIDQDSGARV